ncbi:LysR family transcriptional regulator [Consotaella salsifontis]|uniref:Transcriptional regulator, LysR family n=1 Tax=Consotaella salsifontis TaxID=1365950 RepID=A0A1T4RNM7_9HYPH|nr:LysR family transcriptional regulator [Consotaella salsifontis]SKA17562.1 transcriptional regulator, LysR family [Consotaella salsifontis]
MEEKLHFLLALAREKHFGRAAQVCGVSQPNLSAAIKQLEATLGVPLVDRGSRFIGFTAEGERVLEWARRILGDFQALRADIEMMKKGETGHVRIAAVPTALPVMARHTSALWDAHPGVRITVYSQSSTEILSKIDNLQIDAGITYLDNEPVGHVYEVPLYRERYHLITSADGPYGERKSITWEEAASLPLCLLSREMQNRRIIDHLFEEVGAAVEPKLETTSITVIQTHVATGVWSTILPRVMVEVLNLPQHIRAIPLVAPEMTRLIGMVVAKRDPQPPLTAALIAQARALAPLLSAMA